MNKRVDINLLHAPNLPQIKSWVQRSAVVKSKRIDWYAVRCALAHQDIHTWFIFYCGFFFQTSCHRLVLAIGSQPWPTGITTQYNNTTHIFTVWYHVSQMLKISICTFRKHNWLWIYFCSCCWVDELRQFCPALLVSPGTSKTLQNILWDIAIVHMDVPLWRSWTTCARWLGCRYHLTVCGHHM